MHDSSCVVPATTVKLTKSRLLCYGVPSMNESQTHMYKQHQREPDFSILWQELHIDNVTETQDTQPPYFEHIPPL